MGSIVIREVAALVLKPALGKDAKHDHARYYGLITLNQVVLSRDQPEVAAKLLDLYFEVFQDILSRLDKAEETKPAPKDNAKKRKSTNEQTAVREQKEEGESKLLAAVLTGAHRALPFAKEHLSEIASSPRLDALYKLTHIGTFNSSIQALQLLFHMTTSDDGLPDRFYRTLYDCLIDDRLAGSTKFSMYLNLLFKALKSDKSLPRVMAFVKRLVQVMLYQAVPFVVGALHLLGQLWSSTPGLKQWLEQAPVQLVDDAGDALQHVYDGRKREPQFAGADKTCLWEVVGPTRPAPN
jgi:ribosome biogenesis protein MAK21